MTISVLLPKNKGIENYSHRYLYDFVLVSQVTATFFCIVILWSLWISPSLNHWLTLMAVAGNSSQQETYYFLLGLFGFLLVMTYIQHFVRTNMKENEVYQKKIQLITPYLNITLLSFCVVLASEKGISFLQKKWDFSIIPIMKTQLSKDDGQNQFKGYYENILKDKNFSSPLWQEQQQKPKRWRALRQTNLIQKTDNSLMFRLLPNQQATYKGAIFQTNRFGLRDKDYPLVPDKKSIRIALLGGSIEMGSGVGNSEIFEALVEDQLNQNYSQNLRHFEILNFAFETKNTLDHLYLLEHGVLDYYPRYLIVFQHSLEWGSIVKSIRRIIIKKGVQAFNSPFLQNIIIKENLLANMTLDEYFERLKPYQHKIFQEIYQKMIAICNQHQITPILVYLPSLLPPKEMTSWRYSPMLSVAHNAGFYIIDMSSVYDHYAKSSLWVAIWDRRHPNAQGHKLIAQRLYDELVSFFHLNSALLLKVVEIGCDCGSIKFYDLTIFSMLNYPFFPEII